MVTLPLFVIAISVAGSTYGQWLRHPAYRRDVLWSDFLLGRMFEATFGLWIFAVGSSIASFLNVVAWRVPRGMTVGGHSICPKCRHAIRPSDNVPIVGWLRLRGACRDCSLPISGRYVSFELLGGLLLLALFVGEFLSGGANLPGHRFSWDGYGLNSDLRRIPAEAIWVSLGHALVLMSLLAIFMTRWSAAYLTARAIWIVTGLLVLLHLWQPATAIGDLMGRPLGIRQPESDRWRVVVIDLLSAAGGGCMAVILSRVAIGNRYAIARAAEKETIRPRLRSAQSVWIAAGSMLCVTLRLPLGLSVIVASVGLALLVRMSKRQQHAVESQDMPSRDAIFWLLPITVIALAMWSLLPTSA